MSDPSDPRVPCPHVTWERTLIMSTLPNHRVPIAVLLTCSDCFYQQNYYDDPSAARAALAEAEAEIDRLRRALAFACKDGWSDQQGAMEHYLAMADDWTATRTQEAP